MNFECLGLIAGEGKFPLLLARAARDRGLTVQAVGISGVTDPSLAAEVDTLHWIEFGQFNRMIQTLRSCGVRYAAMAGRIKHSSIFQLANIDLRGIKLLARSPSRKADALLGAVTEELARDGITVIDSTLLLRECMPAPGLLTAACPPDAEMMADMEFGRPLATQLAGMDIGQTLVVKSLSVVAVEAMEGTNETIMRAGEQAGAGCVVIKVAKPLQDNRFDVPVIGLTTIRKMIKAECRALAIPGNQALFFDQEEAVALAEQHGISILAWDE